MAIPNKSPLNFFGENGVGVSRDCPIFLGTPIISGTGKLSYGQYGLQIWRVHLQGPNPNKSPLNILEKREHRRIQVLRKFFGYPRIISGTGKATDFKFCRFIGSIVTKAHEKCWEL